MTLIRPPDDEAVVAIVTAAGATIEVAEEGHYDVVHADGARTAVAFGAPLSAWREAVEAKTAHVAEVSPADLPDDHNKHE